MVGEAEARGGDHLQVVCAVAARDRLGERGAVDLGEHLERTPLAIGIKDLPARRAADAARKPAVLKDEAVADHARHAEAAGDVRGDLLEAARDDVGGETVPREKVDEVKGAGRRNGPLDGVGHDLGARSRECGHALAQRLVKRNQPFHRPAGDSGDPFARTREGGHLVDALALNERRVHVEAGDAKAPEGKIGRQEQDVDGALFGHGRKPRREALRAHARKTDEAGSDELRPEVEAVCKSVGRTVVARKKHVVHRFSSFNQSSSSVRAPSGRPRSGVQPSLLMRWAQVT